MKQISGNCIIPFGLWGEDPPDHLITCIEIIDDVYIVTGDKLGQIIVWQVGSDDKINPLWYLLGHSGMICTLARSMISESYAPYIISLSANREIGIWNCYDGRCIRFERHLSIEHKAIKAYQSSNSKTAIFLCCGHYAGIQVLDSMTLKLMFSLQSRAHSDWIRSMCVFPHKHRELDVVLGLSISGAITMWTIESIERLREDKVLFETESKMLMLACPISISICPSKPRIVMVLASASVQIYDAASWSLLSEYNCIKSCFQSGWFLNPETILLRQRNGQCRLYNVPISVGNELEALIEPRPMTSLDCDEDDMKCESVTVLGNVVRVAAGCGHGNILWWKMDLEQLKRQGQEVVIATDKCTVKDKWREMNMASLSRPFKSKYTITCCYCESAIDCVMMGTSCGDILVMELLQSVSVALFSDDDSREIPFTVLSGHSNAVLALRYAKIVAEKEGKSCETQWLWSGSEDFSVRLWNLDTSMCVSVFHCHGGPVTSFVVGPTLGLTKGKHDGRIMAPKKAAEAEQEVLRPINAGTWFGQRLYVSLDNNNGVAFLSLETKRVVLQLSLFCAVETIGWRREQVCVIVGCVDGSVTVWDLGSGQLDREEVGQVAEDVVDGCSDVVRVTAARPVVPRVAHVKDRLKDVCLSSMMIHQVLIGGSSSSDSGTGGRYSQILLCDTESLLVNIHSGLHMKTAIIEAQILLSLLHQWGQDSSLDKTLLSTVGLMRPPRPVCHGHVNTATRTLSFPLKKINQSPSSSITSIVVTTLSLVAGLAICHAVNNLPDSLLLASWPRLSSLVATSGPSGPSDNRTEIRQVCCFLATSMAIGTLSRVLSTPTIVSEDCCLSRVPLLLEILVHKYQDRCLEVREAARTLMHTALDLLSGDQRHDLVQYWVKYTHVTSVVTDDGGGHQRQRSSSLSSIYEGASITDWCHYDYNLAANHQPSSDYDQLQATALSFLGIVGCRYGSPDLQLTPASNAVSASLLRSQPLDKAIRGFGLDDYRLARTTCGFLMHQLLTSGTSDQKNSSHWSTMRCLAITLLGQGFPVWEPYLEISMLFTKLLDIVAPAERVLSGWTQGQILSDEMDAVHSARSSLHAIALARPKVFATVLSIEVLRLQTQYSAGSVTGLTPQPSVVGGSTPSTNGQSAKTGPLSLAPSNSQPALLAARHEVIDVIKMLCEKKTREIQEVLPEIMDILLACLSKLDLRQYDLQQLFPPVVLFRIASSHTASGKVCVGTRTGHVSFYDVKIGKYNTSPGHGGPVTSVTFSPDGKQMASYSMPDNSVCIWQLFSSGLFGMGSSHQVKLASKLNVPPVAVSDTVADEDSSLLLWLEWSENKAIHLVTNAGLINKIKL